MTRRWIAAILALCAMTLLAVIPASAAAETSPAADGLWEPYTEADPTLSTGQITYWCCVTFGAYPQTEIVAAPSGAVDDYAVQDGDFCVDPVLYEQLERPRGTGTKPRSAARATCACTGRTP